MDGAQTSHRSMTIKENSKSILWLVGRREDWIEGLFCKEN